MAYKSETKIGTEVLGEFSDVLLRENGEYKMISKSNSRTYRR